MGSELNDLGSSGLKFFGTMTASISHEIKNVLAIVSENAGLLSDLILMAEKGIPINLERLAKIAETLKRSVKRSDAIIKNLNTFAHSSDNAIGKTDVGELIIFAGALFARLASMRGVTLVPVTPKEPLIITTHTFFLELLLWWCIEVGLKAVGEEKIVKIFADAAEGGACIRFCGLDRLSLESTTLFSSPGEQSVIDLLRANIASNTEKGELILSLTAGEWD